jgi:hypothetical protein
MFWLIRDLTFLPMSTQNGNIAEGTILAAMLRRKFEVLVPFGDGHPYDLATHLNGDGFFTRPLQDRLAPSRLSHLQISRD